MYEAQPLQVVWIGSRVILRIQQCLEAFTTFMSLILITTILIFRQN